MDGDRPSRSATAETASAHAAEVAARVEAAVAADAEAGPFDGGYVAPFSLHEDLGDGWLYVADVVVDPLARLSLPLLAEHAANALYAAAFAELRRDEAPLVRPVIVEAGQL